MALIIMRERVKEIAGGVDDAYDAVVDRLVAEWTPVLEFEIVSEAIADSTNAGLRATLVLGATEIVAGEFLAQRMREPGAADGLRIGEIALTPPRADPLDPSGLKAQGRRRLSPYLKSDPSTRTERNVAVAVRQEAEL